MNTFEPYVPIEKVPLFTEDGGMQSKMYSIKMEVPYPRDIQIQNGLI